MKEILSFLEGLKGNNHREWMEAHKGKYLQAKQEFEELIADLIQKIAQFDPFIAGVDPKKCIFRIHRDVRFSKDKRPYKENMGGFITRTGRKGTDGGYYLHIEPGHSMLAGGVYMPPADILRKIRQEIDYNAQPINDYMHSPEFKKYFGSFEGEKLKKAPKGYDPSHPAIELLKLKSYIVVHTLSDKEVQKRDFPEQAAEIFKAMLPLNNYLRLALHE